MAIEDDAIQFNSDVARIKAAADIISAVANGSSSTTVTTGGGQVRSLAKLIGDGQETLDSLAAVLPTVATFDADGDTLRNPDGRAIAALGMPFKKKTSSEYLSGRQRQLAPFSLESVYGNGHIYSAAEIDSTYPDGIPGLLERVVDTTLAGSTVSAVPAGDIAVWRLKCLPTHEVTEGRPRSQIIGRDLEFRKPHRIVIVLKLHQTGNMGWTDKATDMPTAVLFALSQQTGDEPNNAETGQLVTSCSPLYLTLQGSTVYPEIRSVAEEMGFAPDDADATDNYMRSNFGDTRRTARKGTPAVTLFGNGYHEIVLDFLLDERRLKDGGTGYLKATFNGVPWFEHHGSTSAPRNALGNYMPCMPRLGFYEVSGSTLAVGTLCSAVNSCTVERSIDVAIFSPVDA